MDGFLCVHHTLATLGEVLYVWHNNKICCNIRPYFTAELSVVILMALLEYIGYAECYRKW